MSGVTINVDSITIGSLNLSGERAIKRGFLARDKILLLSSIALESDLYSDFITAAQTDNGSADPAVPNGVIKLSQPNASPNSYDRAGIATRHNGNKNNATVIALVGGKICPDSIAAGDFDPSAIYIAIVGSRTALDPRIVGGINLQSPTHAADRRTGIINHNPAVYNINNVYLYRNLNSDIDPEEQATWAPPNTFIDSTAGGAGGNNDPTQFANDFAVGGLVEVSGARGLVISDDPFF
jgi:hypothetical protein